MALTYYLGHLVRGSLDGGVVGEFATLVLTAFNTWGSYFNWLLLLLLLLMFHLC